ncbi:hypothetical protein Smp_019460 [Schistosoma mansoni]|uniref:hypothetical protein n=1 Tax=Schistosoma mansoni TaxID=6183 RepID=UPI0001A642E9|nr:hypothetical protein Smp_019460 [Schistosoma mansoni]|eukprot:XP_018644866.1 hypothetical protein Smp_019460 [Schistosoma mansoni]
MDNCLGLVDRKILQLTVYNVDDHTVIFTMIPYTESCGNYTRVPPIANIHSSYHIQQINSNGSSSTCASNENTICSRRGRRSNVPPEIREQTRRLKKQNMERRRRACISDKMNALHNLAMNLIGVDPQEYHKAEKADILNLCQSVFEGIFNMTKDEPELKARLRKLRYNLNEIPNSSSIASTTTSSSSLFTSTNNSTSNLNENMNVNGKDNSLRKFTRHPHQHRSYHQSQQHSHSTNNIYSFPTTGTTTTANTNTQMFSTSTISPPLPTIDQTIDEDDKENRIPRLLIKTPSSLSCDDHLSAFSVPVARSGLAGMNKSVGLHPTSVGHGKVDNAFVVDSISCTQGLISSSTGVSSETISTKDPVMWRPYLD